MHDSYRSSGKVTVSVTIIFAKFGYQLIIYVNDINCRRFPFAYVKNSQV